MTYNTLVLDCDGTLLNSQGDIDPKTIDALIEFQEKGNRLILASGRPALGMEKFVKALQLDTFDSYYISFNGAEIFKAKTNEKIYEKYLERDEQRKVYDFLKSKDLIIATYHNENIIIGASGPYVHDESRMTGMSEILDPEYFNKNTHQHPKILGVGEHEVIQKYQQQFLDGFSEKTAVTTSQPNFVEFIHSSVSKGSALNFLAENFDVSLEKSIGVGDSHNDLSLLLATTTGIAVDNAIQPLKNMADDIVASNDDLGVIEVIEKYF